MASILFDIGHPAHVHLLRNFIKRLIKQGDKVIIVTRDKEMTNELLEHYKLDYQCISVAKPGLLGKFFELIQRTYKIMRLHQKYQFDSAWGTSVSIGFLSLFYKVKSYNLNEDDDATVPFYSWLAYPFSTKILNPDCIKYNRWADKRILYNSYHELAYLHPDNFTLDERILQTYDLAKGKYIVFRFSALSAHHDLNAKGLSKEIFEKILNFCGNYKIVKSVEKEKNHSFKSWHMHHILAGAKMIISDSQTMSIEAAVLGVPSLRINSFMGKSTVLDELEFKYQLTVGLYPHQEEKILNTVKSIINSSSSGKLWEEKCCKLYRDKVGLNEWLYNFYRSTRMP